MWTCVSTFCAQYLKSPKILLLWNFLYPKAFQRGYLTIFSSNICPLKKNANYRSLALSFPHTNTHTNRQTDRQTYRHNFISLSHTPLYLSLSLFLFLSLPLIHTHFWAFTFVCLSFCNSIFGKIIENWKCEMLTSKKSCLIPTWVTFLQIQLKQLSKTDLVSSSFWSKFNKTIIPFRRLLLGHI